MDERNLTHLQMLLMTSRYSIKGDPVLNIAQMHFSQQREHKTSWRYDSMIERTGEATVNHLVRNCIISGRGWCNN